MTTGRREDADGTTSEITGDTLNVREIGSLLAGQVGTTDQQGSEPNAAGSEPTGTPIGTGAEIRRKRRYRKRAENVELETLVASTRRYLEALTGYDEDTVADMERRLRNVCKDIWALWIAPSGRPRVATTDPAKFKPEDIKALIECWQERGLKPSYQAKLLDAFNGFLLWHGNSVIPLMRKMKHVAFPQAQVEDIVTLARDEVELLRRAAQGVEGWKGEVARFIIDVLPHCGLRPTEARTQELDGVDTKHWRITVTHPKGENRYKRVQRTAVVAQSGRQALLDFLAARETYLNGEKHKALIPWRSPDDSLETIGQHIWMKVKQELERVSGIKFKLKDLRALFCQTYIDQGIQTDKVSQAMRHSSTAVTERYYGRIKSEDAFRDFDEPVKKVSAQFQSSSP